MFVLLLFAPFAFANEAEVFFSNGEIHLSGTLLIPASEGRHPAIVLLHGSGPSKRSMYRPIAQKFTDAGFVTLIYDKRGTGKSEGSWIEASLDDLSNDASAAISFLKTRAEVKPDCIGVWGVSQAGWIAPLIKTPFQFLIVITGGGASPFETEMYGYEMEWKHAGFTENEKDEARELLKQYFDYLRTGSKRSELLQAIEKSKTKKWYASLSLDRILPSDENRKNWSWVAEYDPVPDISKLKMPVLLFFGEKDFQTPTELAVKKWKEGLKAAKNSDFTIRVFPNAAHAMTLGEHTAHGVFIPEYFETMTGWLNRRAPAFCRH
jgi:alpha-beta hydrolase superfamily lysophospholipase